MECLQNQSLRGDVYMNTWARKGQVKWLVIGGIIAILIIALVVIVGNNKGETVSTTSEGSIKIGFLGPLTGDAANLGVNAQKGVQLAVQEINAAGGINGRNIEVTYEDGKCNAKDAATAGNKLINFDKVTAIIGGLCSSETIAVAPVAEQQKVIMFSGCSSNPSITTIGDYIFRDYPSDAFQGVYAAGIAKDQLKAKNAAILYCLSDWCVAIKDVFKKTFTAGGGSIVVEEGYEQTTNDLKTQLTKIKEKDPDMVYFVGYTEASIIGIKQMKELGMDVPALGGDAWDDTKIWTETGAAGEGKMWTVVNSPIPDSFKEKMNTVGVTDVTICGPQVYDATMILADIMKRVGTDPEKIKNELYKVKDYQGVSGVITLDTNGDLASNSYVTKVAKNGKGEILYK